MKRTRTSPTILRALALAATVTSLAASAHAIDFNWTNAAGDNDWFNAANWNAGADGVPGGGDGNFVRFTTGASGEAVLNATPGVVQDYLFGNNGDNTLGSVRQLTQTGGDAVANGWLRMGFEGTGDTGTYNLSGGSLTAGRLDIGELSGTTSTVNLSGNGIMRQVDQADPGNGDGWSFIAGDGGSTGVVNLSGDALFSSFSRTFVGRNGLGTVNQTGGIFEARRGEVTLGDSGTGVYNISHGTLRTLSDINNGDTGGDITLGQWDNSHGTLNVSGDAIVSASRSFNLANGREFADDGVTPTPQMGTVNQTGGTVSFAGTVMVDRNGVVGPEIYGSLRMSDNPSGISEYNLSSGTLRQNDVTDTGDGNNWNAIGGAGIAEFNLSGDAVASFDARTFVGRNNRLGLEATVNQTGGLFEVRRGDLTLGDGNGHGIYNISAGTVQTGAAAVIGQWDNSEGRFNISGTGVFNVANDLTLGGGREFADDGVTPTPSTGILMQSGGTVNVGGNLNIASGNASQSGTYELTGGTLNMTGGSINRGADDTFLFNGGRLVDAATINFSVQQLAGTLAVGPDGGTGLTTINGDYTQSAGPGSGPTLELSIVSDSQFDTLLVNGLVGLSGILSVVDDFASLTLGQEYIIVDNDGADAIVGAFLNAPDGGIYNSPGGNAYRISYSAGDGNDVSLTVVIPEPATGALLLGSMGMFALLRRRRP